jgi:cytochrome c peroxidase
MNARTSAVLVACSAATLLLAGAGSSRALDLEGLTSMEELGALIFFDETLSIRQNQSCASCHVPEVGWVGDDSEVNLGGSVYEGSRQNRLGNRKPPSSAYATQSPLFGFNEETNRFEGGNFWDGRATGWKLGNPAADQTQGPFLNPVEQALPDAACVVNRVCEGDYGDLFREVWQWDVPSICQIRWPANTFGQCNSPNGIVKLSPAHRGRVDEAYDKIALSIAAFEASKASNAFTSKIDAFRSCEYTFTDAERRGQQLFGGKGKCSSCHTGAPPRVCPLPEDPDYQVIQPLFSDFAYHNLGVPKNPLNPMLKDNPDWVDPGLGGFLATVPEYADQAAANFGKHKTATTRNVALGACEAAAEGEPCVEKAYMHNGYFKTLKQVVHFYNTRDVKDRCEDLGIYDATVDVAMANDCWPAPEVEANLNTDLMGNLGLTDQEEDDLVALMKAMSDGYWAQ